MPDLSLVIQEPANTPAQLIVLCHAAGEDAASLLPLGERLRETFPLATIVSLQANVPAATPKGFDWFSAEDLTDENRLLRVAERCRGCKPPCAIGRSAVGCRLLRPP